MKLKIAIFGLGTVGGGTLELLQKNRQLIQEKIGCKYSIAKAVVKNPKKKRALNLKNITVSDDANFILEDETIDLIFEATGDKKLALQIIKTSLAKNKKIITANKALLAEEWAKLNKEICHNWHRIAFDAAVGGAIPIINSLQNGLAANKISNVYGIINGTCNFILSKMSKENLDFKTALKIAQELGYAEPDPTLDIGGIDTAHKLIIMLNLIHRSVFDFSKLYIEGIENLDATSLDFAKQLGYKIKLLAISKKKGTKIQAHVHPSLVSLTHPLANISGADNAILVEGDFSGPAMLSGAGAGAKPTASAMVSDLIQLLKSSKTQGSSELFKKNNLVAMEDLIFQYFIQLKVKDRIGVLEGISTIFTKNSISIKSMRQIDYTKKSKTPQVAQLILVTHQVVEKNLSAALKELQKEDFVVQKPSFIRILD